MPITIQTRPFPPDSLEKQVYNIIEKYREYIPRENDRNRLGYSFVKFMEGEGDPPLITVRNNKLILEGITELELARKIEEDLKSVKIPE